MKLNESRIFHLRNYMNSVLNKQEMSLFVDFFFYLLCPGAYLLADFSPVIFFTCPGGIVFTL